MNILYTPALSYQQLPDNQTDEAQIYQSQIASLSTHSFLSLSLLSLSLKIPYKLNQRYERGLWPISLQELQDTQNLWISEVMSPGHFFFARDHEGLCGRPSTQPSTQQLLLKDS